MKHRHFHRGYILIIAAVVIMLIIAIIKPSDQGAPYTAYFSTLNEELKKNGPGRPVIIVDLDRLDRNTALLKSLIKPPLSFRLVVKSLPSMRMVRYIMERSGTGRLMLFHQPDCSLVAEQFGREVDILLGKPMPVNAVREFYKGFTGKTGFNPALQIQWLADTPERLRQYLALAEERKISMRISVEIDVGLHRGGAATNAVLDEMLGIIAASRGTLVFSGFMGYDVYTASAPAVFSSKENAVNSAFTTMLGRYREFYKYALKKYPALFDGKLTFNSGGSHTYRLFRGQEPVNDIAVGSALVMPSDFDTPLLKDHEVALFIATPVLKKLNGTKIPFLEILSGVWSWWDPNKEKTYFIYGGGWRAAYYSPSGLEGNSLYGMSTNQSIVNGSGRTAIEVDDHIFLRPTQSEGIMREFGDILVIRGGRVVDRWPAFPE
jgi:D-serine deaminase-like pyridoxal phosphate-dependent protein